MEPDTLSRREKEIERHRREILQAAEKVFAERGYVSATMEEVARKAEFGVGTLYKFFENKADLYTAILSHKLHLMEERVYTELEKGENPTEKIKNCFRVRLSLFWDYPDFFRLLCNETAATVCDPRAGFNPEITRRYELFLEKLEKIFEEGVRGGEFKEMQASTLTLAFEGILRAYLVRVARSESLPERNRKEERDIMQLFLEGACRV